MSDTPQPQLFTAIHRYLRESKVEGVTLTIEPGAQEDTASVVLAATGVTIAESDSEEIAALKQALLRGLVIEATPAELDAAQNGLIARFIDSRQDAEATLADALDADALSSNVSAAKARKAAIDKARSTLEALEKAEAAAQKKTGAKAKKTTASESVSTPAPAEPPAPDLFPSNDSAKEVAHG